VDIVSGEIVFDPAQTSYRDILEFFFQVHDPTTRNRQGNDTGLSYRSAIFYLTDEQQRIACDTIADVDASGLWPEASTPRCSQPGRSGKPNLSTRTTSSATPTATPATSPGQTGSSRTGNKLSATDRRLKPPVDMALSGRRVAPAGLGQRLRPTGCVTACFLRRGETSAAAPLRAERRGEGSGCR